MLGYGTDQGFEPQVMKVLDNTRKDRQTVLFSATFPRQVCMRRLAGVSYSCPMAMMLFCCRWRRWHGVS